MENRMEELQLQLAEGATKVTTKVHFSQVTLQERRSEIFELGKKMSVQSKEVCGLAVDLASAKNEMRLLNFRALELAQQIEEAKQLALLSAESNKCLTTLPLKLDADAPFAKAKHFPVMALGEFRSNHSLFDV
ncbi:hypothetical protein HUJ04_011547 [Dendroctonus ponderosae]|nr:hypothetical protein HUJ04_011547 [Dendroctonus ponderosae]